MILQPLTVTLELVGPVMTKSTTLGAFGTDSPMAQSGGRYYLPGSLVRGRLREAWQELSAAAPDATGTWRIDSWLGRKTGNREDKTGTFEPERASIYFEDFFAPAIPSSGASPLRYRIRIDSDTGAVETGAFQVIEAPWASGDSCDFSAEIRLFATSADELKVMTQAVGAGLRWISSFGAERTVGFGALRSVTVKPHTPAAYVRSTAAVAESDRIALALSFTQPLIVASKRPGNNLFESDDVIPGAAIRGAIAQLLNRGLKSTFPALYENLSKVRITHAFPAAQSVRRAHFPLSLVNFKLPGSAGKLSDFALLSAPPADLPATPEFAVDWKDPAIGPKVMGWPDVPTEIRVRTAIEGENRKQRDQALFATRMLLPQGLKWLASADLSRIKESTVHQAVAAELRGIMKTGLPGIGKTRAFATCASTIEPDPTLHTRSDGRWIVCLQTPALLLEPSQSLNSQEEMELAYKNFWHDRSAGSLVLENYFQSNTLVGGDYLHRRFRPGQIYLPYFLTNPGSVFVLQQQSPEAVTFLGKWLRCGLPLTSACRKFYCDHADPGKPDWDLWPDCPFIPENGYGEIAVNLPVHASHAWPNLVPDVEAVAHV